MNYCENCIWRINEKCTNSKIQEDYSFLDEEKEDMMLYSYTEGGYFWVGPKFGCVHHVHRKTGDES